MTEPTITELLDFEAAHPERIGRKESRIIDELGIKPARYYQLLHRAADSAVGIAHDPITSRRIRARRSARPTL